VKHLIRDRDARHPAALDTLLAHEGTVAMVRRFPGTSSTSRRKAATGQSR
jgi:hypothetical protein